MTSFSHRPALEERAGPRRRLALRLLTAALMAGFGPAVYLALGHLRHLDAASGGGVGAAATEGSVTVELPGTLTFAQGGDLYRLRGRTITELLAAAGSRRWSQPAAAPGGALVVVGRGAQSSDLFEVGPDGEVERQLTADAARTLSDGSLARNHWAFHPRVGPDGTLWYAYDAPKAGFRVDLAIWSRTLGASASAAGRRWSTPHDYTGGDVEPAVPGGGGVLFVRYAVDERLHIRGQLWLQRGPGQPGQPLTALADDCGQPDLSPAGGSVAMVCTAGGQTARLEVAAFDGSRLGPPRTLATDCLCAHPTWAPDGSGLVYIAPGAGATGFDLWWVGAAATPAPEVPRQVTERLDLDATSRPAWTR